jgi:PAS domain S-box-containing protein
METKPEAVSGEIRHLQRCINDLVSLLALPAIWSGGDPTEVLHTLLDALVRMLRLDLVSVRLTGRVGEAPVEIVRTAEVRGPMPPVHDICDALSQCLEDGSRKWPPLLQKFMGEGEVSIVPLPLGVQGELGMIVAAAQRPDFPQQTEALLLSVAASQASIGLREAQLRIQQKRIAEELDRRVAERTRELAETNAELQLQVGLLQLLPVSAWTLKPDGTPDFVNHVWLEYSGQTLEFVRSHPEAWMTAVHPEDREIAAKSFWQGVHSGQGFAFESRSLRAQDGTYRWHLQQAVALRDAEGKVIKFVGTTTDIDDQKRAQEVLRASETNLREILDGLPGLAAAFSPAGVPEVMNRPFLEFFGKTAEEMKNWKTADVIYPDDLPLVIAEFTHSVTTGTPYDGEIRYRRAADGIYRWFQVRIDPASDAAGRITGWYSLITDIDDRKRAEEKLRRSEALLAQVQRVSLTGGFSWRVDTDDVTFSEEAYRIFEFEKDAPVTLEQIASRVHPEDIPSLSEKIELARGDGGEQDFEIRLLMPNGSVKYLHTISHGIRDREGRLEVVGAAQDITRRRLSEEALGRVRSELAHVARVTSLGVLTASIAHEVNQPLSGIITNAGTCLRMLAADPPNVDGASETARRTIRDGHRASEVISRLRALYGKKEPTIESVDLNEATREVLALSLSDLQRNRVIVQQELAEDSPLVAGNRVQLQQVILNLIRNASDAMSAVDDRPRQLLIRTEEDGDDRVRLTVRDAGVGFAPQSADRLFESFYTTKNDGMGIGLSVSRSIIESHHGRLWATLNTGPGATFSFSIPRASAAAPGADSNLGIRTPDVSDAA